MTYNAEQWLAALAAELDTEPPTKEQLDDLLDLAGVAARASERIAAPVSCWLAARAGVDPSGALAAARRLAEDSGPGRSADLDDWFGVASGGRRTGAQRGDAAVPAALRAGSGVRVGAGVRRGGHRHRPGRHVAFAQIGSKFTLTFGLPGNPVAALVAYELFVRPALRAMAGHVRLSRPRLSAIAAADLRRRPGPKLHLVRVIGHPDEHGRLRVRPSGGQDSHMLKAMAGANALALVPDSHGVRAGYEVEILLLDADLG